LEPKSKNVIPVNPTLLNFNRMMHGSEL